MIKVVSCPLIKKDTVIATGNYGVTADSAEQIRIPADSLLVMPYLRRHGKKLAYIGREATGRPIESPKKTECSGADKDANIPKVIIRNK